MITISSKVRESLPEGIVQFCSIKAHSWFRFQIFLKLFLLLSWVGGAVSRKRICCHPIRRSHFAKRISLVASAARRVGFCFVILTLAVCPPIQRRARLLGATGNPQPFLLSLLQSRIAPERQVLGRLKERLVPKDSCSCKLRVYWKRRKPQAPGLWTLWAESILLPGALWMQGKGRRLNACLSRAEASLKSGELLGGVHCFARVGESLACW